MSLTQTLMNGGMIGTSINPARYNHDNGALRIATESVEELHDIFMTTFYATEQAELGAVHEGVALEESSYAAVYEGAVKDAFTKVKEFFKKLWDKVKAWCHNVKRFFDSLIMSGKDFVKKYRDDIRKANNLKDFTFKMFNYNNDAINKTPDEVDIDNKVQEILDKFSGVITFASSKVDAGGVSEDFENVKKTFSEENVIKGFCSSQGVKSCDNTTDFTTEIYAKLRGGAESKEDKEEVDVNDLSTYASYLENTVSTGKIDSYARKIDNAYKKALKFVDDASKEVNKVGDESGLTPEQKTAAGTKRSNMTKTLSAVSSAVSVSQNLANICMNEWKSAVKERDGVYKQLIIAGLSNSRKNSKKK